MYIIVEVDDPRDVGKNEKARYIAQGGKIGNAVSGNGSPVVKVITATIEEVHPATPGE